MSGRPLNPAEESHLRDCLDAIDENEIECIWATVDHERAARNRAEAAGAALKEALGTMFGLYGGVAGKPWSPPAWMQRALSWKAGTDYIPAGEHLKVVTACRAALRAEETFAELATDAGAIPWGGYSCANEAMVKAREEADRLRAEALAILERPIQK